MDSWDYSNSANPLQFSGHDINVMMAKADAYKLEATKRATAVAAKAMIAFKEKTSSETEGIKI